MAISADGAQWFLVNASPDLRSQIESFPPLQPRPGSARNCPIAGVLLTNADLDHTLGLFLLREGGAVQIYATAQVRSSLAEGLSLERVLASYGGAEWHQPCEKLSPLADGLLYRSIPLPGGAPRYAPPAEGGQSIAYEIVDQVSGSSLVVAPDVAAITPELRQAMQGAALLLFDGTFWVEDELRQLDGAARLASEMGHLPVQSGSLPILRDLPGRRILLHINNTNPILRPGTPQRAELEAAGIEIGEDGMEVWL